MTLRVMEISPERWREAWALHVTLENGVLHINIEEFAASVGVPTDPEALEVLGALTHRYAELLHGPMPCAHALWRFSPKEEVH